MERRWNIKNSAVKLEQIWGNLWYTEDKNMLRLLDDMSFDDVNMGYRSVYGRR